MNMSIRKRIINNAKAYNKYLTNEYLEKLSTPSLLRNANPADRFGMAKITYNQGLIDKIEFKEFGGN
jgi:hypothetical protein